jgi:hypothetical protein
MKSNLNQILNQGYFPKMESIDFGKASIEYWF